MSLATTELKSFRELALDPRIVEAIAALGFTTPTPIQAKAIPPLLDGRDLVGRARTGSGKTAAFGLPLLEMLSRDESGVRALVLAPTRELALQISDSLLAYGGALSPKVLTLYGGAPYQPQLAALKRGVDVVVGTPGRLQDHLRRGSLDLSQVRQVIIDEADEMLRMGFIDDVRQLLQATPEDRQVALFCATMPEPIREVAESHLRDPLQVEVERGRLVVDHIEQFRIDVPNRHEMDTLVRVLKSKAPGATLIFARTRLDCDELAEGLRDRGFVAQALHGNMSQAAREDVLSALRTRRLELVVATDVASRGIDVEHLTHVINVDMPQEVEVYVNRIGRTARAGRKGVAINLVSRRDLRLLRRIEQLLKKKIHPHPVPTDAQIAARQRAELDADLQSADRHPNHDNAAALSSLLQQGQWTPETLATAALGLLMRDRNLDIESEASPEPPTWAQRPERKSKKQRDKQSKEAPRASKVGKPRAAEAEPMVVLKASVGREQGVHPRDVVGALANELGIATATIGRIAIFEQHLTVSLSEAAGAQVKRSKKALYLRGTPVNFTPAGRETEPIPPPARRPRRSNRPEQGRASKAGHRRNKKQIPKKSRPKWAPRKKSSKARNKEVNNKTAKAS